METQASLIGTDGAVKLHSVAYVHLHFSLIIYPGYTESHHAFGLHDTFDNLGFLEFRVLVVYIFYRH